ncbi:MAG TPA: alpha/beta fold hydrolase [Candidatus Saccharimonadales bacterium]|nr:alpha/beta fold hydrolase [Candidatus Saccharimonadales bacterium]
MAKRTKDAADYILPLNINGLQGRMLRVPSSKGKQREILLIYGHHAVLERWQGLVDNLIEYGNVTMPDLPGFGGMEGYNKAHIRPDLDAFADYLASFIKLRYKRKRVTVYAISYGFVVVTRMLQRYPELAKKIDLLISFAGFMHHDDILYGPAKRKFYGKVARLFATRPVAFLIRYCGLNKPVLNVLYKTFPNSRRRMIEVTPEEFALNINFEKVLWQSNDVRTHWLTTSEFLKLDNLGRHISLPVVHVVSKKDHYLNNLKVEEHMRQVFSEYTQFVADTKAHVPSVLADKKAMGVMLPAGLRRMLAKKPKSPV